jgi:hypothetical protein
MMIDLAQQGQVDGGWFEATMIALRGQRFDVASPFSGSASPDDA